MLKLRTLLIVSAALLAVPATASAVPAPTAAQTVSPTTAAPVQGIIMRDGGVCDPIRHMGC